MENLTGGTPPVRYLPCVVPCKLYFVEEYIHMRNPDAVIFPVSARTGEGMDAWTDWLEDRVNDWNDK